MTGEKESRQERMASWTKKVRGTAPNRAGWREKVAALSASWHQKERTNERIKKQTNELCTLNGYLAHIDVVIHTKHTGKLRLTCYAG